MSQTSVPTTRILAIKLGVGLFRSGFREKGMTWLRCLTHAEAHSSAFPIA